MRYEGRAQMITSTYRGEDSRNGFEVIDTRRLKQYVSNRIKIDMRASYINRKYRLEVCWNSIHDTVTRKLK
jgi:hypothetical protein